MALEARELSYLPSDIDQAETDASSEELFNPNNITSITPYLKNTPLVADHTMNPGEAFVLVSREGLKTEYDREVFTDKNGTSHHTRVLHSEMYYLNQNQETGEIKGMFLQYTQGYTGDEYGIINPRTVPNRELYKDEYGHLKQDNSPKEVAYTGNETKRVLEVIHNPQTQETESSYIKARNLRYALADKARLDKVREDLRKIRNGKPLRSVVSLEAQTAAD